MKQIKITIEPKTVYAVVISVIENNEDRVQEKAQVNDFEIAREIAKQSLNAYTGRDDVESVELIGD